MPLILTPSSAVAPEGQVYFTFTFGWLAPRALFTTLLPLVEPWKLITSDRSVVHSNVPPGGEPTAVRVTVLSFSSFCGFGLVIWTVAVWAPPEVAGLPPQCQPPWTTPTPGSERNTEPSSLTLAVPMLTNIPRSWSKEYISVTWPGARPSTFGMVIAAGGSKRVPAGWMGTMTRGCWPE